MVLSVLHCAARRVYVFRVTPRGKVMSFNSVNQLALFVDTQYKFVFCKANEFEFKKFC
jgi:hypothetical protein